MQRKPFARAVAELRRLRKDPVLAIMVAAVLAALALFIIYPLVMVVFASLRPDGKWSLGVVREVLGNAYLGQAFRNSLMMGTLTAVIGSGLGFLFAFAVTRADVPFKRFLHAIAIIPIVSPPFIGALAIIMLFGNNGLITWNLLRIQNFPIYGFRGLMFAQAITFFPVAYMTLRGVLESINPTLEDAALDLGGSRFKVFMRVTLPLAAPGIASAMLVLFIETLADFGNPLILAGSRFPILSVQAYLEITGMYDLPKGATLSILLLIPSITAWIIQKYWVSRKRYVTITGKPTRSSSKIVSPAARAAIFAGCLFVAAVVILVYVAIIWGAFAKVWGNDNTPTLKHFQYVFSVGFKAVRDTLTIAGLSTPIAGLLGMIIAFLVVRKRFPGRRFMEFTSMLSFAVPGTVIGIGYILAFNRRPLALTGTLAILLLNFVFRYIPVGIESGRAILMQIDPSIEEAAVDLGADSKTTFFRITLPMIVPAYFSGLVFTFVRAMTAISAAIFLVSARWNLMTVQIMSQVESGRLGAAAAFSVILVAIIFAAIFLIRALLRARYGRYGGSMLNF
ncbi:MAG: ABC transporter permease [Spirochaetae bacterium HGW-Spirochaetae-7]|jgi:iron(III) transport system permease protein|nr:MAG: ABC transporter permease [Spirochaetae bacterium HGW-Spirochaetae-7]